MATAAHSKVAGQACDLEIPSAPREAGPRRRSRGGRFSGFAEQPAEDRIEDLDPGRPARGEEQPPGQLARPSAPAAVQVNDHRTDYSRRHAQQRPHATGRQLDANPAAVTIVSHLRRSGVQATHQSSKSAGRGEARHLDPERVTEADHHSHVPGRDYVMHTGRHTLVAVPRVSADERSKHRARKAHKLFRFAAHSPQAMRAPH
jgi:hypothetical protein